MCEKKPHPFDQEALFDFSLHTPWRSGIILCIGALAQLGERKVRNLEVRGSIPLCSTNSKASIHAGFDRVGVFFVCRKSCGGPLKVNLLEDT